MQNIFLDKKLSLSVIPWIAIWVAYTVIHLILKPYTTIAGTAEFIMVNGLNVILAIYFLILWRRASVGKSAKMVFLLFALSYWCVVFESSIYHAIYNVLHISRNHLSLAWLSSYNMLYIVFLLLQFAAWTTILLIAKGNERKSFLTYFPISMVVLVVLFISGYATNWGTTFTSLNGVYDFSDKLLEVACVVVIALCLAAAKCRGLLYLSLGFLIDTVSSMIMDFGLFSQGYGLSSFLETGWVFGKLLMLYGLLDLSRAKLIDNVHAWVAPSNSIRTQTAYWCFIICIVALVIFFAVAYFLNPNLFF